MFVQQGRLPRAFSALIGFSLLATACSSTASSDGSNGTGTLPDNLRREPITLTLLTHDSFNLTESLIEEFTATTGITVEILRGGDAGAVLNQAILTKDNPIADVIFGIDDVNLARALDEEILSVHPRPMRTDIDPATLLDPELRAIPVTQGDVCVNYDRDVFSEADAPQTMDDLRDPAIASQLVVQDPSTSSPGLAFLLASVAAYGQPGWQDFWTDLRDGGVTITSGWEDAYYGEFSGGAGEGDNGLVVSYASSPPAEVAFGANPDADVAPTGVSTGTCFHQIEFAGTLTGTEHGEAAADFVDFLLSTDVQQDIPMTMFVFPVRDLPLPELFVKHAAIIEESLVLDRVMMADGRQRWIDEWVDLMVR